MSYQPFTPDNITQSISLEQVASIRLRDLAELLCGCVCADPTGVVPLLEGAQLEINRPKITRFLKEVRLRAATLDAMLLEDRAEILTGIAANIGALTELTRWMQAYCYADGEAVGIAGAVIKQLKVMAAGVAVLRGLQEYASGLDWG